MNIRIIEKEDLDRLVTFYIDYFNTEGDNWTHEIAYKRLHQMWNVDDHINLIAEQNNMICGFLMGYLEWFDDGPYFHISEILVNRNYQNKKVGRTLMLDAEKMAKGAGATVATLETLNDDMHEHFYGKLGYSSKGNFAFKMKRL